MKYIIIFLFFICSSYASAQNEIEIIEGGEVEICGKTVVVDGIWIDNGRIKADISNYTQKNSKPITGGYKMDDTIEIKPGCVYYIKEIEKYGLTSDKGYVILTDKLEPTDYLGMGLSNLRLYDKFNIGNEEWTVQRISKDDADFEIKGRKGKSKTVTLKKNDIIWKGFEAYYISDFLANATDMLNKQWTIEIKEVKDYSYLSGESIPGELINGPPTLPTGSEELIIRKMKFYPKQKFNQEEYDATPVKYWVLKVLYYHGGIARQTIEVERLGKKMYLEFDAYKSFDTEEEALEFARVNGVTDIKLEESK